MITFRNATADDVSLLQALNDEVFVDNIKYVSDLDMNWAKGEHGLKYFTELVNNEKKFCIIAEDEGKQVGYLAASPRSFTYKTKAYTELDNMGVTPEYQSKGIGSLLIDKYLEWSREGGYEKAYVNAFAKNTGALEFYRNQGFTDIDISLEREL